jgi:hypothetical protein
MRALVLAAAMVAAVSVAAGSALAQQETATVVPGFTMVMPGSGCPVGFAAEVSARAVMHSVDEDKKYGTAPALELTFVPKGGTRVVKASVTVHGLPVGSRVMPVGSDGDAAMSEKFELVAAKGLGQREVRVMKLGVVRWAEVTEMQYADGTTWRPVTGESCRAVPPLYKEVNAVAGR